VAIFLGGDRVVAGPPPPELAELDGRPERIRNSWLNSISGPLNAGSNGGTYSGGVIGGVVGGLIGGTRGPFGAIIGAASGALGGALEGGDAEHGGTAGNDFNAGVKQGYWPGLKWGIRGGVIGVAGGSALEALSDWAFCFVAGTLVATAEGQRPIETIRAGDLVWAYDFKTSHWYLRRVVRPLVHNYNGDFIRYRVREEEIASTGNHPCWVIEGEALVERPPPEHVNALEAQTQTPGRWVDARDLRVGDVLLLREARPARITELSRWVARSTVYNLHVAELHTYAVGQCQVLVHNRDLLGQWDAATAPRPPGWGEDWTWEPPSGEAQGNWRWWDPHGGEWRWHAPDRWHPEGHWDHNPWLHPQHPWVNVIPDGKGEWRVGPGGGIQPW
jgi:hypothetical protein